MKGDNMAIFIAGLPQYASLCQILHQHLTHHNCPTELITESYPHSVALGVGVAALITQRGGSAIVIDDYGIGCFNAINKAGNIVCANGYDEHSAKMTKDHNNTQALVIGAQVITENLAKSIALNFAQATYAGGRHQVRVDMLSELFKGGV
jgi:RpiB/LacA/LacB family sugar-phosphate isomerase